MKKIYSLLFALIFGVGASFAQSVDESVQFCDKDGNVITNGTVLYRDHVVNDGFGGVQIHTGLYIKNTSNEKKAVHLLENISEMPHGTFQTCILGVCMPAPGAVPDFESAKGELAPDQKDDIQTEWFPEYEKYTSKPWTATIQIQYLKGTTTKNKYGVDVTTYEVIGNGPKVSVVFNYPNPSGIEGVKDNTTGVEVIGRYTTDGKQLSEPVKGLNILKLSNGKTVKEIVK